MQNNDREAAEALSWIRTRWPEAELKDLHGSPASFREARAALLCADKCPGPAGCRFKGYKPVLCAEKGGFLVRWGKCRCAPRTERRKAASPCPVPPLYASCSFANFSTEGSQLRANLLSLVKNCAAQRQNLFLAGRGSIGKTHLAAAYARSYEESGRDVLFFTGMEYFERLRASFHGGPEIEAKTRAADLAVFDDIGTPALSEWCSAKLFEAIDYRYRNKLPVIVTTGASSTAEFAAAAGPSGARCLARLSDKKAGASICLEKAQPYVKTSQTTLF